MRNIFLIAREDFKSLRLNAISILVVVGLICISSVYAWVNIAAGWDPYKNTGNLKVAVVNEDTGCTSKYLPIDINVGDAVVSKLHENPGFNWIFVDKNTAMDGLENGEYYAAIVIPDSFSKDMMSVFVSNAEPAQLYYYRNEKYNSMTPKMTDQGANAIQKQINESFTTSFLESVFKIFNYIGDTAQSKDVKTLTTDLINTLDTTSNTLNTSSLQIKQLQITISSLSDTLNALKDVLPQNGSATQAEIIASLNEANSTIQEARAILKTVEEYIKHIGGQKEAQELINEINALLNELSDITSSANNVLNNFDDTTQNLNDTINSLQILLSNLNIGLDKVSEDFMVISSDLNQAKEKLQSLSSSTTIDDMKKVIGDDPVTFSTLLTKPVQVDRQEYYSMENNGSAMAAFYISLAMWIGCSLIGTIITVELSKKRLARLNKKAGKDRQIKRYQIFFGRYITFGVISLLQTLLICFGALFFLRIQCVHPICFIITAIVLSLTFSFFIYTLIVSFGNVGKALAVILLVLQVAGSGGIFPYGMLTDVFSSLYPYLPFSWSIKAFNYCVAGFSAVDGTMMWLSVLLSLFAVLTVISLLLGLVFRVPIIKFNDYMASKLHETHLIG